MTTLRVKLIPLLLALTAALPVQAANLLDADQWAQRVRQLVDSQELSELLSRFGGEVGVFTRTFNDPDAPSAAQTQTGPGDTAAIAEGREVSLEFRGPLSEAIRTIARQGGLNVVTRGLLDQQVQVNLHGLPARRVLEALAEEHALTLTDRVGLIIITPKQPSSAVEVQVPGPPAGRRIPTTLEEARQRSRASRQQQEQEQFEVHMLELDGVSGDLDGAGDDLDVARQAIEGAREELDGVRIFRLRSNREGKQGRDLVVTGRSETVLADQTVNDVVIYGGSLDLKGKATGNVLVFGGNADVEGSIQGDALIFGGQMRVEGSVDGDVLAMGGNVDLGPDAVVRGSVRALGGHVRHADGAHVHGSLEDDAPEAVSTEPGFFSRAGSWLGTLLTRFVLLFGLGFLAFMLVPARMRVISEDFKSRPGSALGLGFFAMLALVPFIVLLCITIVGIPIALLLIPLVPLLVAVGLTAIALELGRRIPVLQGRQKTQASALALGLIPLVFISTLPVLGALVIFVLSLVALGSMVRTRVGSRGRDPLPTTID